MHILRQLWSESLFHVRRRWENRLMNCSEMHLMCCSKCMFNLLSTVWFTQTRPRLFYLLINTWLYHLWDIDIHFGSDSPLTARWSHVGRVFLLGSEDDDRWKVAHNWWIRDRCQSSLRNKKVVSQRTLVQWGGWRGCFVMSNFEVNAVPASIFSPFLTSASAVTMMASSGPLR